MKKIAYTLFVVMVVVSLAGCSGNAWVKSPGMSSLAPGQIKKTTGSQSAKPYAPGQKKKN